MYAMRPVVKYVLLFAALVCVTFLPIYPEGTLEAQDPVSVTDPRVIANINDGDLQEILHLVRHRAWGGFWGLVARVGNGRELIEVRGSGEDSVEVQIGNLKAPHHGRGSIYFLNQVNGSWRIDRVSEWVA